MLSTSEAFIEAEGGPPRDPFAASYPRRADRSRPLHTCPYTTIFHGARSHVPYRLPHSDSGDPYADAYSVDRSSNLTDTSSFARYEDCRSPVESIAHQKDLNFSGERLDSNNGVQQKVPYASNVFFISTQEAQKKHGNGANLFVVDGSESDALSSCTCDSFERCEFDCRDFEPFSDTCCCDPLGDGACSRSPKEVESPEQFCDGVVEEDRVSVRSDMDGLDLTLFEPAQTESKGCDIIEQNSSVAATLCGILHVLTDSNNGKW